MVDVVSETVIGAPLGKVVACAANPDYAPAWHVNVKSARLEDSQTPARRLADRLQGAFHGT